MSQARMDVNVRTAENPLWIGFGSRLRHIETGTPAIVEQVSKWSDGRVELVVRFGGNPRTDPWGPFVESPRYSDEEPRDLERITIERGQLDEWGQA